MSNLDEVISNLSNVLDYLRDYQDIQELPTCNDCADSRCFYRPKPGQMVRFNCPLWQSELTKKEK